MQSKSKRVPTKPCEIKCSVVKSNSIPENAISQFSMKLSEEDSFFTEWGKASGDVSVLKPNKNIEHLSKCAANSSVIAQCVRLIENAVAGYGFRVEKRDDAEELDVSEETKAKSLLSSVCPDLTFRRFLKRVIHDLEYTGIMAAEVVRNKAGGFAYFIPILPHYVRLCSSDNYETAFNLKTPNGTYPMRKRFRRYVMRVGNEVRYFKEWRDPRFVDFKTGMYYASMDEMPPDESTGRKNVANEIFYLNYYDINDEPYGRPRWFNELDTIAGEVSAAIVRKCYFNKRGVPGVIITVSGGEFPEGQVNRIKDFMDGMRERENPEEFYSALVLHAQSPDEELLPEDRPKPPTIGVKEIHQVTPGDGFFLEYSKDSRRIQCSSMGVPPALIGDSEVVSKADFASMVDSVEKFLCGPMRRDLEEIFNNFFYQEFGFKTIEINILGPDLTDYAQLASAISRISGAVSPNDLRPMAGKMLGMQLKPWTENWADWPLIFLANSAGLSALGMTLENESKGVEKIPTYEKNEDFPE